MRLDMSRCIPPTVIGGALLISIVGAALSALPGADHVVSLRGNHFRPEAVSLHPGEHLTVVNDEREAVHHIYSEASDLAYDSGDMEPSATALIAFPKEGDFQVLCAIHPRMRLAVQVR